MTLITTTAPAQEEAASLWLMDPTSAATAQLIGPDEDNYPPEQK